MSVKEFPKTLEAQLPEGVARLTKDLSLARTAAAGSLVAGACLLLAGRRKGALAAAVAAGALMALDHPEGARKLWDRVPEYLRHSQDFLVKMEDVLAEVTAQGEKLRKTWVNR